MAIELKVVLEEERKALISLNTDQILITTSQKEALILKISRKRSEMKHFAKNQYQEADLDILKFNDLALQEIWLQKKLIWKLNWEKVQVQCEANQKFIRHSMKNLGLLVDNLKRLFGQHPTYSASGKKVDASISGNVVEARY